MEKRFESLDIFEFMSRYKSDEDCLIALANLKWKDGFSCKKCKNTNYCADSKRKHSRKCTKCNTIESPTAGTLFHKVKFSLLKAFWIIYYVSTNKKGIASTELSRKLSLRQKTCWFFKQKVMKAMESSGKNKMTGEVVVDETSFGQKEEGVVGRKAGKKKKVVVAIEKKGNFGVSRIYAQCINRATKKELGNFMKNKIDKEASVKTDKWKSYISLKDYFPNLETTKNDPGKTFPSLERSIMMLKSWLRGIHHSVENLQAYLDEYCYRQNRFFMKGEIFDNLLLRMVNAEKYPYRVMKGN